MREYEGENAKPRGFLSQTWHHTGAMAAVASLFSSILYFAKERGFFPTSDVMSFLGVAVLVAVVIFMLFQLFRTHFLAERVFRENRRISRQLDVSIGTAREKLRRLDFTDEPN
tara:strand:+ start:253 stop:591 length:339 start_codon:yes stop_codon:yes gene_type:complete